MSRHIVPLLTILAAATPAERTACTPDVLRFCSAYIPNQSAVIACLLAHRAELSPACRAVIRARR